MYDYAGAACGLLVIPFTRNSFRSGPFWTGNTELHRPKKSRHRSNRLWATFR
jgi:hypothetical protein